MVSRVCQHCRQEFVGDSFLHCSMQCRIRDYSRPDANGCWVWVRILDNYGYGRTNIRSVPIKAHRASYEAFVGPIPQGMLICHRCDNRACVNPDHLFAGTWADNSADMTAKGRQARGEKSSKSKLTADKVVAILADHRSSNKVAADYGVSGSMIRTIRRRETWKHVK